MIEGCRSMPEGVEVVGQHLAATGTVRLPRIILCNINAKNDLTAQSRKLQGDVSFSVNFFLYCRKMLLLYQ